MLFRILKNIIQRGNTEGLSDRVDVLYAAGKLSDEQYQELSKLLTDENTKGE